MERFVAARTLTAGMDCPGVTCPECGGKTTVYRTTGNRRNRKCLRCGYRYVTRELLQSQIDNICGMVDTVLDITPEGVHVDGNPVAE